MSGPLNQQSPPCVCLGYFRITNLDWSGVLIELLQEEYSDIPELTCTTLPI